MMPNFNATQLLPLIIILFILIPNTSFAHCDSLEGPVVKDAKLALEQGDVTPVLKWVKEGRETEVQQAFSRALIRRAQNPQAKDVADMEFFETIVRIHRQGEGEEFTGLKPIGLEFSPAVNGADKALETRAVDDLVKFMSDNISMGIRQRFENALKKKEHAEESVEAGREYVEAYVEFLHYVEDLYHQATRQNPHSP